MQVLFDKILHNNIRKTRAWSNYAVRDEHTVTANEFEVGRMPGRREM